MSTSPTHRRDGRRVPYRPECDRVRDAWFHAHGWFVLRFDDNDVLNHIDETVALIIEALGNPDGIVNPLNLPG